MALRRERRDSLAPAGKKTAPLTARCPCISLQRAGENTSTRALWFSVFESGARSGAGCCFPAPLGRREVWEGRLVAEDARIFSHVFTRDDGE